MVRWTRGPLQSHLFWSGNGSHWGEATELLVELLQVVDSVLVVVVVVVLVVLVVVVVVVVGIVVLLLDDVYEELLGGFETILCQVSANFSFTFKL